MKTPISFPTITTYHFLLAISPEGDSGISAVLFLPGLNAVDSALEGLYTYYPGGTEEQLGTIRSLALTCEEHDIAFIMQ